MTSKIFAFCFFFFFVQLTYGARYTPDWPSLDSRPLPEWFDKAKVGIFMHFGPYAVPGVGSEWFWMQWKTNQSQVVNYMRDYFSPQFTYQDFGSMLKMEFFDADEFADLVEAAGAKYIVFTSKHHDGFTNFDSKYTFGWNSLDIGPKRDVIMELKEAFDKKPDLHFGLYYSLFEWFNPIYLSDKASNYTNREYVLNKMTPELKDLVTKYKPEVLWSDGDWEASYDYWESREFLAWLFNDSPTKDTVVTNDRWGVGTSMKHGSYYSGPDRFNPGQLLDHKWESAMTVDSSSWGNRRDIKLSDILSPLDLISNLASTVSCGGNILINVGPTSQGTIIPIFEERLKQVGSWLKLNGRSIYETVPWTHQNDTSQNLQVWYTQRPDLNEVYGIVLGYQSIVTVSSPKAGKMTSVRTLCDEDQSLNFQQNDNYLEIQLPSLSDLLEKCGEPVIWANVLVFKDLENQHEDPPVISVLHF